MLAQPDDSTCGPTCLHAVYRYFGIDAELDAVIAEVERLPAGGTLPALLGCHALGEGFRSRIYSFELQVFDPTWRNLSAPELCDKLRAQLEVKDGETLSRSCQGYLQYIEAGGELAFEDLTGALLRRYLLKGIPILAGLSSTYLYQTPRERNDAFDDIGGKPSGHFVVLCGYDASDRSVLVADPYLPNPVAEGQFYRVPMARLVCAIMLGVLTFDASLLIVQPRPTRVASEI